MSRFRLFQLALSALAAGPSSAQQLWQPELGVQGGYNRQKLAGTHANDALTFIGVPGGNYLSSLFGSSALFGVIPVGRRLAVEPHITATQLNATVTTARIGARVDYAISPALYAAAGGVLNYISQTTPAHTQVGLQFAVGYRRPLADGLNGRLEATWVSMHSSDLFPAFNTYSLLAGLSSSLRAQRPQRLTTQRGTSSWDPLIGIAGGYVVAHRIRSGSIGGIFLPGTTSDLAPLSLSLPGPASLFAVLPLRGPWALEPSFDLQIYSPSGAAPAVTTLNGGLRLDYAVTGGWYGGAGTQLVYVDPATGSSGALLGVTLAWGYRFHLAGALGGRFETSYSMFAGNHGIGTPPVNTFGLLLGVLMPLR